MSILKANRIENLTTTDGGININNSGQVAIGVASASKPLHIYQTADAGIRIQNSTTGTGTTDGILLEATGSDGLFWNYESGNLRFATGNSERLRINSSGNVLVGKTTTALTTVGTRIDSGSVDCSNSSSSTNLGTNSGGSFRVANTDSTDNNFSNIGGYNSNGLVVNQINFINTSHSSRTGEIGFSTHNGSSLTERMRIRSNGQVEFKNGSFGNNIDCVMANSGTMEIGAQTEIKFRTATNERMRVTNNGLTFNGDTAAANALDDYEEGDFTPSWGLGLTNPSYVTQLGKYTKIGRTVYFTLQLSTNGGTANSSDVRIDGLPFNAIGTSVTGGAFVNYVGNWGINTPYFYKNQSDATLSVYDQATGAAIDGNDGNGIDNINLYVMGFYHT